MTVIVHFLQVKKLVVSDGGDIVGAVIVMVIVVVVVVGVVGGQFLILRQAYVSNLSSLLILEPFKKFVVEKPQLMW